jgi:hypothetical protein
VNDWIAAMMSIYRSASNKGPSHAKAHPGRCRSCLVIDGRSRCGAV